MGKSARSNSKKKLRTQRREQVVQKTVWLASADEKRQAALAACIAAPSVEYPPVPVTAAADDAAMETADKPVKQAKKGLKVKKGAVVKQVGKKKKCSVLAGKFYKKGKKGQR